MFAQLFNTDVMLLLVVEVFAPVDVDMFFFFTAQQSQEDLPLHPRILCQCPSPLSLQLQHSRLVPHW